jgi:hypothetical protein
VIQVPDSSPAARAVHPDCCNVAADETLPEPEPACVVGERIEGGQSAEEVIDMSEASAPGGDDSNGVVMQFWGQSVAGTIYLSISPAREHLAICPNSRIVWLRALDEHSRFRNCLVVTAW